MSLLYQCLSSHNLFKNTNLSMMLQPQSTSNSTVQLPKPMNSLDKIQQPKHTRLPQQVNFDVILSNIKAVQENNALAKENMKMMHQSMLEIKELLADGFKEQSDNSYVEDDGALADKQRIHKGEDMIDLCKGSGSQQVVDTQIAGRIDQQAQVNHVLGIEVLVRIEPEREIDSKSVQHNNQASADASKTVPQMLLLGNPLFGGNIGDSCTKTIFDNGMYEMAEEFADDGGAGVGNCQPRQSVLEELKMHDAIVNVSGVDLSNDSTPNAEEK